MIITHGFCFSNIMYSHDSLYFASRKEYLHQMQLGRWLYGVVIMVRRLATPWLCGILSIIYVSCSVLLVVRLLKFDKAKSLCVSVLFVTNIALIALFGTYINSGDIYCLALLCACFSVYSFEKISGRASIVISVFSLIFCLALYQPYICVAIGLFLSMQIYKLNECRDDSDLISVYKTGGKELLILLSATAIYILLMKIIVLLFGLNLSDDYNGAGKLFDIKIKDILISIPKAYGNFAKAFLVPDSRNNYLIIAINISMFLITCFLFVMYVQFKKLSMKALLTIILFFLIFPLGLNAIYVVSFGTMHQLMTFAYNIIFFLPLILSDNVSSSEDEKKRKLFSFCNVICTMLVGGIILCGFNNIVFANEAYAYKKIVYDNTLLHAQRIWEDINSLEEYEEGRTPVVFLGEFEYSEAAYKGELSGFYQNGLLGSHPASITYNHSLVEFYSNISGRKMIIEDFDESKYSENSFNEMPKYPEKGYCIYDNNVVFVKLIVSNDL